MKRTYLILAIFLISFFSCLNSFNTYALERQKNVPSFEEMIIDWASVYMKKISSNYTDTLNLHLKDTDSHWYITIANNNFKIYNEKNPQAKMVITADFETYKKIYTGELNGMTAIGRASVHQSAPLDMWLENGMTIRKINWEKLYYTVTNFFNAHPHNKVLLGREHSRNVHGGNVVALYYSVGFRSAYYNMQPGETLNESGEKDPFNQSFVIISGKGFAKIGNDTLSIAANEAYYIKPNIEHKVWTDSNEGISLVWNAWGNEVW
jgi:mannose-6-phosphate isomerase-like protein (cupin superfamily)